MIVAVSMRVVEKSGYPETRDAVSHDWIRFLDELGVAPLLVPNVLTQLMQYFQRMDVCGIILTSGNDVGPQPSEEWSPSPDVAEDRDRTENALVEHAIKNRIPLMGVCRGMQFINAYFGGTLVRDVATWANGEQHAAVDHRLKIVDSSYRNRLRADSLTTNSFHDQGVTLGTLAPCLKAIALSEAGVVEGLYHPAWPVLGIQWHPERSNPDRQLGTELFRHWLGWCAGYSSAKSAGQTE